MTVASGSRQQVLASITKATAAAARPDQERREQYAAIERSYVHQGERTRQQTLDRMKERLHEYDAGVVETTPAGLAATIAAELHASGHKLFVVPAGLAPEWLPEGFTYRVDHGQEPGGKGLEHAEIEQCEGVVTAAFCAVADSGTIVLHHGPAEGRRVLTLLPDYHLCILRTSQVVETLPEYFARCAEPPRLATTISGPSATADIEMTRIKGVHGPRFLQVILVDDEA